VVYEMAAVLQRLLHGLAANVGPGCKAVLSRALLVRAVVARTEVARAVGARALLPKAVPAMLGDASCRT
jgi:hypothetical protein